MEIKRSALLFRPATTVFELIERAEDYPKFLPWCADAVILERSETIVAARITVDYHGLRFDMTTRNPKRRPHWMAIHLESGPFRRFEGEWRLSELTPEACKAEFTLRYELGGALLSKAAGRVFDGIANTLVDAYARRAEQLPLSPAPVAANAVVLGDAHG
jgi:ribosome-associated toxin RatA of RatAB toxin-antitoxin module